MLKEKKMATGNTAYTEMLTLWRSLHTQITNKQTILEILTVVDSYDLFAYINLLECMVTKKMSEDVRGAHFWFKTKTNSPEQISLYIQSHVDMIDVLIKHAFARRNQYNLFVSNDSPWKNRPVQNIWRIGTSSAFSYPAIAHIFSNYNLHRDPGNDSDLLEAVKESMFSQYEQARGGYAKNILVGQDTYGNVVDSGIGNFFGTHNKQVPNANNERKITDIETGRVYNLETFYDRLNNSLNIFIPREEGVSFIKVDKGGMGDCFFRMALWQIEEILQYTFIDNNRQTTNIKTNHIAVAHPSFAALGENDEFKKCLFLRDLCVIEMVKLLNKQIYDEAFFVDVVDSFGSMASEETRSFLSNIFSVEINQTLVNTVLKHIPFDLAAISNIINVKFWGENGTLLRGTSINQMIKDHDAIIESSFIKPFPQGLIDELWNLTKQSYPLRADDNFLTGYVKALVIMKRVIENRLTHLIKATQYVGTYHFFAIASALKVNIVLMEDFTDAGQQANANKKSNIYSALCYDEKVQGTIYSYLSGTVIQAKSNGHFYGVEFVDTKNKTLPDILFQYKLRHFGYSSQLNMQAILVHFNTIMEMLSNPVPARFPSNLLGMINLASMAYFANPSYIRLFFEVFYNIIAQDLLDQIKYIQEFVFKLNINYKWKEKKYGNENTDNTGRIISYYDKQSDLDVTAIYDGYDIIHLPITLGFVYDEGNIGYNYESQSRANIRILMKSDVNNKKLQTLIDDVALQTIQAMYDATVLITNIMSLEPELYKPSMDYEHKVKDYAMRILKSLAVPKTSTDNELSAGVTYMGFDNFFKKVHIYGFKMYTEQHRTQITTIIKTFMQMRRADFRHTAFFNFYSVCLFSINMFLYSKGPSISDLNRYNLSAIVEPKVKLTLDITPSQAQLSNVALKFANPAADEYDFSIGVKLLQNYNPEYTKARSANDENYVLAWFSSNGELAVSPNRNTPRLRKSTDKWSSFKYTVDYDAASHSKDVFAQYVNGTRVAFAPVDIYNSNGSSVINFKLDRKTTIKSLKGTVYLHVAIVVRDGVMFKRRGHAFIDLRAIFRTNNPFDVSLWEGPVKTSMSISPDCEFIKALDYKKVFDLQLTVNDPKGNVFVNERAGADRQQFFADHPNSLFTQQQMKNVCQFLIKLNQTLGQKATQMHSLLYVNFPMHLNVAPLWAALYMPPIFVHMDVLRRRLDIKLHDEGLRQEDFVNICAVALQGVVAVGQREAKPNSAAYQRFAMQRFLWILVQIINPFNKMCYKLDEFESIGGEQMNYPLLGVGDCEDTAQAVCEFIRGIQVSYLQSGRNASGSTSLFYVLEYLMNFTPCMCVMSTSGPNYKVGDMDKGVNDVEKTGLHMLCSLVPLHMIKNNTPEGAQIHPYLRRLIPVETTGFNFNSYVTPNTLLEAVNDAVPGKTQLLASVERYNEVVRLSMQNRDVDDEKINLALMINNENVVKTGKKLGSGERRDSFVTPHYFYGKYITMCHSLTGPDFKTKFLDFFTVNRQTTLGVEFKDAILTLNGDELASNKFRVSNPLGDENLELFRQIDVICQEYANNVQPVPLEISDLPKVLNLDANDIDLIYDSVYHEYKDEVVADYVESLKVRSVTFYINKMTDNDSLGMIRKFKEFIESDTARNQVRFPYKVSDVEHHIILNGAVEFYALHVSWDNNVN